jgi:hypothetical protein
MKICVLKSMVPHTKLLFIVSCNIDNIYVICLHLDGTVQLSTTLMGRGHEITLFKFNIIFPIFRIHIRTGSGFNRVSGSGSGYSESGSENSESGSTDPIGPGSNSDPDPQPWFL